MPTEEDNILFLKSHCTVYGTWYDTLRRNIYICIYIHLYLYKNNVYVLHALPGVWLSAISDVLRCFVFLGHTKTKQGHIYKFIYLYTKYIYLRRAKIWSATQGFIFSYQKRSHICHFTCYPPPPSRLHSLPWAAARPRLTATASPGCAVFFHLFLVSLSPWFESYEVYLLTPFLTASTSSMESTASTSYFGCANSAARRFRLALWFFLLFFVSRFVQHKFWNI